MPHSTRVMAVIHHRDDQTSLENAAVARDAGCAGVFLIQMEGRDHQIDAPAVAIKQAWPEFLVGCNRLSGSPAQAILTDLKLGLDATWIDNPGVYSYGVEPVADEINMSLEVARNHRPGFLLFGSVAFKTQAEEPDPAAAALKAAAMGWIATTSGKATGHAPSIEKLATMKQALGGHELAVASGVSPENAADIAAHVDWVLVATGVSRSYYNFDPDLLANVVAQCSANPGYPA